MKKTNVIKKSALIVIITAFIAAAAAVFTVKPIETNAAVLPTCYQQGDARWAYEQFGMANIGASGCGLLSTVNAVNYQTGNFINPVELARWGYENDYYNGSMGQGTARWQFYPALTAAFGKKYGFKVVGTGWSGGNITSEKLVNHLKNGGSAIVHVHNHFMALNGYNAATGQYLVYDSAAAPKRNTSVSGSYLTAAQLNSNSLTIVDGFCLIVKDESSTPAPPPVTTYTLKAEAVGNGKVHFGDNVTSATVQAGTVVNYQTTPDSGYKVTEILINGAKQTVKNDGGDAVYQFVMPSKNTVVSAKFEKIAAVYKLKTSVLSGNGKVHFGNGITEAALTECTPFNFEVNPAYGEKVAEIFVNDSPVSVQNGGRDCVYSFSMPKNDVVVYVKFVQSVYALSAKVASGSGAVHFGNDVTEATVTAGTVINYQTTPASGYKVAEILINGVPQTIRSDGADAVYSFTMPDENVTIAVKFEQAEVILSLNACVTGGSGTAHFGYGVTEAVSKEGNLIYLEVCPDYGYIVSDIFVNDEPIAVVKNGQAHVYSFTMPSEDVTVSVKFKEKLFFVSTVVTGKGTVEFGASKLATATVRLGSTVKFTAIPSEKYKVVKITVDNKPVKILNDGKAADYYFAMPDNSVTVAVEFDLINPEFTLVGESSDGGNIDLNTEVKSSGETVYVRVAPSAGYAVSSVKLNGVALAVLNDGAAATYLFVMPKNDAKFSVEFKKTAETPELGDGDSGGDATGGNNADSDVAGGNNNGGGSTPELSEANEPGLTETGGKKVNAAAIGFAAVFSGLVVIYIISTVIVKKVCAKKRLKK